MYRNHYTTRPSEIEPGDRFAIKVVAVVGGIGDWAAYWGPTSMSDDEVATNGDRIPREAAESLFLACRNLWWRA